MNAINSIAFPLCFVLLPSSNGWNAARAKPLALGKIDDALPAPPSASFV